MLFSQLGLSQPILRALEQEGYSVPTPIQAQTIPHAIAGRDVLGSARTGTGKTAAFALPILHRLSVAAIDKTQRGPRKPRALVLSPTRELTSQIADSFTAYGRGTHLTHTVIYGGVSQVHQERAIRAGVDTIVATPGRLMDLMEQRIVDISSVEIFVLDEADRMLDMGFIHPIRKIASAIKPGAARQTLLFSATMPKEIVHLANALLRDPARIAVDPVSSAVPKIDQVIYMVPRAAKQALLEHMLSDPASMIARALVFTRTKHGADKVCRKLWQIGTQAETIHGNKSQGQRKRALARFSSGAARVLVATDVAARGLDVEGITHVFNFDLPAEPEAYIHRIGRTGRAGASGMAVSFCDVEERALLRDIERITGKRIAVRELPVVASRADSRMPSSADVSNSNVSSPRFFHAKRNSSRDNRASTTHGNAPHGHSTHGRDQPGHAKPSHAKPSPAKPNHAKPKHSEPGHTKAGNGKPGHAKQEHSSHGQAQFRSHGKGLSKAWNANRAKRDRRFAAR